MRAIGTITLETPRLVLRKASVEDACDMYSNWANDPEVTKYLTWKPHPNIEVTRNVLADWVSHYDSPLYMHWLIELKAINQVIGSIGIVNMNGAELEAEVGYCISRQYWNQGITSEALDAVIRYLVVSTDCKVLKAHHDINNPASGKVMQKNHMSFVRNYEKYYELLKGTKMVCCYQLDLDQIRNTPVTHQG